jgi:hypothetical protein
MTAVLLTAGPNLASNSIDANADSNTIKIAGDPLPRRTSEVPRPRGASLQSAAVGEPSSPRKQAATVDASFLSINQPIANVIASEALRRQVDDHHTPSGESLDLGKLYTPLVSGSQIAAGYDPICNRISMSVPGPKGASTEVRVNLSADGKSVVGMEKYEWSQPSELAAELSEILADKVLPEYVLNKDLEVHGNLLDGNVHTREMQGLKMKLRYDPGLHQLRIAGLDPDGGEIRLTLAPDRTTFDGGHKCSCTGPQHVPTGTLGKLVDAGLLADELLAVRLATASHTPRAANQSFLPEAEAIVTPKKPETRQQTNRVPSPVNSSQRPPLGLPLTDVIANTALRNQIHRDRMSRDSDHSNERHKYQDRMANGETVESWYEVRHGLIWITVGSAENAPLVRIRLSPDKKTVLRIDEPVARLSLASKEALTALLKAGVLQPQALHTLYPDPQDATKLQSPDTRERLMAAVSMAMYRTATPTTETQAMRVEQWTKSLLERVKAPAKAGEAAIIDLRGLSGKSQTDVLKALGHAGWGALMARANELGATDVVPLVQGQTAATVINAMKAVVPDLGQAIVAAGPSVNGKIALDLEELDESAPHILIQIEEVQAGDSLEVFARPLLGVTVQRPIGALTLDERDMKVSRREPDGEVRISGPLRFEAE